MGARVTESELYAHLWGTDELRAVFDERARLQSWLDILAALAEAQADMGIVPAGAAAAIAREAKVERLDLGFVAEETRRTGHSTLGLIRGLGRILPEDASEWAYYGITVQDVTDTWSALAMRAVGAVARRDLRALEASLLDLADRYRDTVMAGRTHGQPGAPITFGFKAAGWADEVRRHLDRFREGAPRWLVGQLAGAVGTLGFFGEQGPELRRRFCERLGLGDPGIAWTSSRDRVAEFGSVVAMASSTLAMIGNEVFQLQRAEIGELREPTQAEAVGSITMPHKRNPEVSEHLVTLSRLIRANAAVLVEGMVAEHERDGRGWKAEWVAFPEVCLLFGVALRICRDMVAGLEVDADAMRANLGGYAASEAVLAALSPKVGKHRAQELLQDVLAEGRRMGLGIEEALTMSPALEAYLTPEVLAGAAEPHPGSAVLDTDEVVARIRKARRDEGDDWP
ncbi:MAG TPA: adenylosuccinate lyase family protein [Actinomycetota bacterium]|nr:adenylosuccinate lyase family protein [Actinomycetota bacterium]